MDHVRSTRGEDPGGRSCTDCRDGERVGPPAPPGRGDQETVSRIPVKWSGQRIGFHRDLVAHRNGLRGQLSHRPHDPVSEEVPRVGCHRRQRARAISRVEMGHTQFSMLVADQEPFGARPKPLAAAPVSRPTRGCRAAPSPQHVPVSGRVSLDEVAADGHQPLEASEPLSPAAGARRAGRWRVACRAA